MLKNIKSQYYIKILFSHLNDKVKLNLIKYNKKLQNLLDISLINFKVYKGLYIVYEEKNKKGKLYNGYKNRLSYEGEFLHGKKNGKGKKFGLYGNIYYEGEYFNGIINGKGKEFYYNGQVKFEGNYLNGLYHGEGKYYYYNDKVGKEGEYLNGKLWNGKIYDCFCNKIFEIKNGADLQKNMIIPVKNYYLKVNIKMVKKMEMEQNIMIMGV